MWQFSRSRESVINPLQQMCRAGRVKAEQHAVVADSLGVRGSWHLAARSSYVDSAISRDLGRVGLSARSANRAAYYPISSSIPGVSEPELLGVVRAAGWRYLCNNFAVFGWYLHRQEVALAGGYHVECNTQALREHFGIMAGFLLGHDAGSRCSMMVARLLE